MENLKAVVGQGSTPPPIGLQENNREKIMFDKLPDVMNEMNKRDDRVYHMFVVSMPFPFFFCHL